MSNAVQFLEQEVYPRLDRAKVFCDLEPVEKGNKYQLRCPGCGEREAYVYKEGYKLHCGRQDNCGVVIHILQHLAGTPNSPRGLEFIQAVRSAASLAGVHFEERPKTAKELEEIAQKQAQEQQVEDFYAKCVALPDHARRYLRSRGFGDNIPPDFRFAGANADGYIRAKGERGASLWDGRIVGPIRDRRGHLRGVFGRDLTSESKQKYIYSTGFEMDSIGVIGLDKALANGNKDIVIFEGILDLFRLRAEGFDYGACSGGLLSRLNSDTWNLLASFGVRSVILVTDNDAIAGRKGLQGALNHADEAAINGKCPEVYVVDPDDMPGKDPDEIVTKFGIDAFRELVAGAAHAYRYRAKQLSREVDFTKDRQGDAYINSCIQFDGQFTDLRHIQKLKQYFWSQVEQISNYDMETIMDLRAKLVEIGIEQRKKDLLGSAARDISMSLAADDVFKADEIARSLYGRLRDIEIRSRVEEPLTVAEEIDEHFARWEKYLGKELIGIDCGQPTLNKMLLGARGFGIIAARSNVGKTIQLCELAVEALLRSPNVCVPFWSIEMTRHEIVDRMACYLTGSQWVDLRMDGSDSAAERRKLARQELRRIGARLIIFDKDNNKITDGEGMMRQVARLQDETECDRVFGVVDYIDVIEISDEKSGKFGGNERMVEKEQIRTCQLVSEAIGKDNAFVGISEVRKGNGRGSEDDPITIEDLSGTNRKGYAADWILIMNPLTNKQLVSQFEYLEYVGQTGPPAIKHRSETKDWDDEKELRKELRKAGKIRSMQNRDGVGYGQFSLVKARDGGRRHEWFYTNLFTQSRILEGIR